MIFNRHHYRWEIWRGGHLYAWCSAEVSDGELRYWRRYIYGRILGGGQ